MLNCLSDSVCIFQTAIRSTDTGGKTAMFRWPTVAPVEVKS